MKYRKFEAGEGQRVNLDKEDWCLACCDCGNVHLIQFHYIEGNTWDFAAFPQPRRTGQLRRHYYGFLQQDGRFVNNRANNIGAEAVKSKYG